MSKGIPTVDPRLAFLCVSPKGPAVGQRCNPGRISALSNPAKPAVRVISNSISILAACREAGIRSTPRWVPTNDGDAAVSRIIQQRTGGWLGALGLGDQRERGGAEVFCNI
jgi:hypothetical protein